MANEATITVSLAFAKGNVDSIARSKTAASFDVSGSKYHAAVQAIGTSEEAIVLGDVSSPGWAYFENLDSANFVEIRPNTGVADMLKLKAGEVAVCRLASDSVPYAIADTAAVNLEYLIIED